MKGHTHAQHTGAMGSSKTAAAASPSHVAAAHAILPAAAPSSSATAATAAPASSGVSASHSPNYGKQLRAWFLSLSKHERSCMLVLEDSKTVHTSEAGLLNMFARVQEKGDGYFYGGEEVLDRISESSGRQHHLRHHHGSSLLCTAGLEADCSFCGCNSAARDVDVLAWLNDEGGSRRQKNNASRHRSSSGSGGGSSQQGGARGGSQSSLLNGLNLADPFSMFGSSMASPAVPSNSESAPFMFSSRRKVHALYHSPPDLWASEQQLERSVRLCDTRGYCDTLCVMSDLLEDGSSFLTLLDSISKNGFLTTPCYTSWEPKEKVWLWDVTAWFRKRGYYSLGTYLANKLEMVLWMRYWEHMGLDPRKVPSGKAYVAGGLVRERLSSKSPLAHFWSSLASERREKMLTKLVLLVEQHAHSLQQQYLNLTQQQQPPQQQQTPLSLHDDDDDADDGDESASNAGSVSNESTPKRRTHHAQSSSSSLTSSSAASIDASVATTLSRTRSHSLPRRRGDGQSSMSAGLPPTSPPTPSSTNSAPSARRTHGASSATPQNGLTESASFHSPWSSMQSSFASSLTTSPSASPSGMPSSQLHPPSFTLASQQHGGKANAHHVASPQAGQLTPNLTLTHPHQLRSPTPLSPMREPIPISHGDLLCPPSAASSASADARASAAAVLASLPRHTPWDRSRGVSPDLIRSLMATAEAHELKASLQNQKNKHLTGAFAAVNAAASSSESGGAGVGALPKEKAEKLKELDYDFTMCGLQLLANLLRSLTQHNKRMVTAIPRLARASSTHPQLSEPFPRLTTHESADTASSSSLGLVAAASSSSSSAESSTSTALTLPRPQSVVGLACSVSEADTDAPTSDTPVPDVLPEDVLSPSEDARLVSAEPEPPSSTDTSSAIESVVGLNLSELLLFAERSAASKVLALTAARIESLRSSWPHQAAHLDDRRFIELLFSSPLARAHTNLDKLIRRIGLLLQACYAEQIGVDLIMGEESEEQSGGGGGGGSGSAAGASLTGGAKKAAKKKAKKKLKKAVKKGSKEEGANKGDDDDGEEEDETAASAGSLAAAASADVSASADADARAHSDVASAASTKPVPSVRVRVGTSPSASRSASAEPSYDASAASSSSTHLSPTLLSRSFSSHSTAEESEPWQRVGGRKSDRALSKSASAASTPTKPRAKDDSYAEKRQQQSSAAGMLHTPPPAPADRRQLSSAGLIHGKSPQHVHASAHSPAHASPSSTVTVGTPSSPHFSSSLSFPSFHMRPSSWSAAASLRLKSSTSTSASLSPASTGQHTPTLVQQPMRAARAKDDSFTQQKSVSNTQGERRASDALLLISSHELSKPSATPPVSSSPSISAVQHSRNLSAGSVPALNSTTQHTHGRSDELTHRQAASAVPRSPLIKGSGNAQFLLPHASSSALLPTPQQLLPLSSSYGRTSSLHLAKPVPIHSSTSFSHHGPSSVGLSFSSVPAHGQTMAMQGAQRRRQHDAEYVHGTDDVTLQAWQQKHEATGALAAHRRQQQQIKQHHPVSGPLLPPPAHARVPRPSSARRVTLDTSSYASGTSLLGSSSGSTSAHSAPSGVVQTRPRSNSEGEEGVRRELDTSRSQSAARTGLLLEAAAEKIQSVDATSQLTVAPKTESAPPPAVEPPRPAAPAAPSLPAPTAVLAAPAPLLSQTTSPPLQPSQPAPVVSPRRSVPPIQPLLVQPSSLSPPTLEPSPLSPNFSSSAPPLMLPASAVDGGINSPLAASVRREASLLHGQEPPPLREMEPANVRPRAASSVTPSAVAPGELLVSQQAATPAAESASAAGSSTAGRWQDGHPTSSSPAYHASVQAAQAYHKRNGMQFPPWLNASNLQLLAFIHNTGLTPPQTRSPGASPLQSPQHVLTQAGGGQGGGTSVASSNSNSPPSSGGRASGLQRSTSQQLSGSSGTHDGDSRRPSLTSLMPNFLVLPNINTQQQQLLSSPSSPRTQPRTQASASAAVAASTILANTYEAIPAHAQFIRVLPHPSTALFSAATSPAAAVTRLRNHSAAPTSSSSSPSTSAAPTPTHSSSASSGGGMYAPGPAPAFAAFPPMLPPSLLDSNWSMRDSWKLHDEISVFTNYVTEVTSMRHPILMRMIQLVRECVQGLWSSANVECYGSFMTGLSLPTSDLDLVLTGVPVSAQEGLVQLSSVLRKQKSWLLSLNAISTAKVPVIKLLGALEGEEIIVDITFAEGSGATGAGSADGVTPPPGAHTGVASVALIREYLRVFPALRPLSLVLKQFLFERGLANTYTGGLNSYCLVLMIVGFLQARPQPYLAWRYQQAVQFHTSLLAQRAGDAAQAAASAGTNGNGNGNGGTSTYVPVRIRAQLMSQMASPPPYSPLAATMNSAQNRPRSSNSAVQAAVQRIEEKEREAQAQSLTSPKRSPSTAVSSGLSRLQQAQLSMHPSPSPSPSLPSMPSSPLHQGIAATSAGVSYRFPSPAPSSHCASPTPSSGMASPSGGGMPKENLGAMLVELLHFYGSRFDFGAMAIAVHLPPGSSAIGQQQQQQQHGAHSPGGATSSASSTSPPIPPAASPAAPPMLPGGPPPPATLQLPVRTFNYLSLMHPTAHNLHFPQSASLAEAQRVHACPQSDEDAWGHGVFLLLSSVSRVLVISDPLYPLLSNNIGRSVFAMWRIKAAFDEGFKLLAAKFSPHGSAPTLLARIIQKMQQHHKKGTTAAGPAAAGGATSKGGAAASGNSSGRSTPQAPAPGVAPSPYSDPSSAAAAGSSVKDSPPPSTAPVRGLFHITLPSFFPQKPQTPVPAPTQASST